MARTRLQKGPATDHYHVALGVDQTPGGGVTVDNQTDPPAEVTTLIAPGATISGDEATLGEYNGGTLTGALQIEPEGLGAENVVPLVVQGTSDTADGYEIIETRNAAGEDLTKILGDGTLRVRLRAAGAGLAVYDENNVRMFDASSSIGVMFGTTAPTDGAIAANQLYLWFDATNGAAKVKFKGKSSNGTVVAGEVALT